MKKLLIFIFTSGSILSALSSALAGDARWNEVTYSDVVKPPIVAPKTEVTEPTRIEKPVFIYDEAWAKEKEAIDRANFAQQQADKHAASMERAAREQIDLQEEQLEAQRETNWRLRQIAIQTGTPE